MRVLQHLRTRASLHREVLYLRTQVSEYRLACNYWHGRYLEREGRATSLVSWNAGADSPDAGSPEPTT